jgi:DNA-binding beta-propeller fold protein YncE
VLNGTVTRLDLAITESTVTVKAAKVIASGYTSEESDAALILGPTGLAYDPKDDVLFVASTADNTIFAVPHAGSSTGSSGRGAIIFQDDHLRGPLALVFAPNGNLLTANGDAVNDDPTQPSEIVEFTRSGRFVRQFNVDAAEGGAFGIDLASVSNIVRFAFVNDNAVDLTVTDRKGSEFPDD